MKKAFALLFVAGMMTLASCGSKTEEAASNAIDSAAVAVDSAAAAVDSTVAAGIDSLAK